MTIKDGYEILALSDCDMLRCLYCAAYEMAPPGKTNRDNIEHYTYCGQINGQRKSQESTPGT
jgi:hypothetical protein